MCVCLCLCVCVCVSRARDLCSSSSHNLSSRDHFGASERVTVCFEAILRRGDTIDCSHINKIDFHFRTIYEVPQFQCGWPVIRIERRRKKEERQRKGCVK